MGHDHILRHKIQLFCTMFLNLIDINVSSIYYQLLFFFQGKYVTKAYRNPGLTT